MPSLMRRHFECPEDKQFVVMPDVCMRSLWRVHVSLAYLPAFTIDQVHSLRAAFDRRIIALRRCTWP